MFLPILRERIQRPLICRVSSQWKSAAEENKVLRALSDKKRMKFYQEYLSSTRPVLFEKSKRNNYLTGFTDNYIKVEIPETPHLINQIKEVELTKINPEGNVEVSLPVKVLH